MDNNPRGDVNINGNCYVCHLSQGKFKEGGMKFQFTETKMLNLTGSESIFFVKRYGDLVEVRWKPVINPQIHSRQTWPEIGTLRFCKFLVI